MTLPKKGSRKLVVDGRTYRWAIRKSPTYGEALEESNLLAAVELFDTPASTLLIEFDCPRSDSWMSESKVSIGPAHISAAVRKGIAQGWQPEQRGKTYVVTQATD